MNMTAEKVIHAVEAATALIKALDDAGYNEDQRDLIGRALGILNHGEKLINDLAVLAEHHDILSAAKAMEMICLAQTEAVAFLRGVYEKTGADLLINLDCGAIERNIISARELREAVERKHELQQQLQA